MLMPHRRRHRAISHSVLPVKRGNLSRLHSIEVWVTIDIVLWGFITQVSEYRQLLRIQFCSSAARRRSALGFLFDRDMQRSDPWRSL
jgi:hypothetical protein